MMLDSFKIADLLIIMATMIGPILAVQIQKILEKSRQKHDNQSRIFSILMATRSNRLSIDHVNTLNIVPIEFYGETGKLKNICDSWEKYIDHLYTQNHGEEWMIKSNELYTEILMKMADYLGYKFSYTQIKREAYYPQSHADIENDHYLFRKHITKVLSGESKMKVEFYPPSDQRDSQGAKAP